MRRRLTIILLLLIVGAGAFLFWQQRTQAATEPAYEILREATVQRDRITATVNATGSIEPEALVTLNFGMAGTIRQLNIVRGQLVATGDVLATLNTEELELAVRQAEDALRIQELTLQQRLNSEPSTATLASAQADIDAAEANITVAEANIAAAEAAVLQAQAQKAQLLTGATAGEIATAEANVSTAQVAQRNAQETYDQTLKCYSVDVPGEGKREVCPALGTLEEQARRNLENATLQLWAAEAQLTDLQAGPRSADIQTADASIANAQANVLAMQGNLAGAQANLSRAQAAYDRLLEPPSEDELAILEAQVVSAQTNLDLAQLRLEQSQIVAPINGRIANVLINEGEQAAPGAPAMTIVNEGAFHINVSVDEIDIDRVAIGQQVDITLDALPDQTLVGTIADIAPTSADSVGVVTYLVTINITVDDTISLRTGMSANASIVVQEIEDVLLVPNWAIRLDRETGEAFVNLKQTDGLVEEVVVETGLRNEQFSQVLSGLQAGDVVALTNERETFSLFGGDA